MPRPKQYNYNKVSSAQSLIVWVRISMICRILHWWRQSSLSLTNASPRTLTTADHWEQRRQYKKRRKVRKFVIFIQMPLSFTSILVFYRMIVFSLGSTEPRSISSANYDHRTGTWLFPARKLTQTQFYKSSLLANVCEVCVYQWSEGQVKVNNK